MFMSNRCTSTYVSPLHRRRLWVFPVRGVEAAESYEEDEEGSFDSKSADLNQMLLM